MWTALLLACGEPATTPPPVEPATPLAASVRTIATRAPEPDGLGVLPEGVGIPPGQPAPDATLPAIDGRDVALSELYRTGPVLLVFYRGGWCPFCSFQVRELALAAPEFARRGVRPVLISVDRVDEAARTQATWTVPYPVLSDPDLVAHEAWRVVHEVPAEEVERLRGMGMDLESASGRDHHRIAIPSLFLVGADGVVIWGHAERDYKERPSVEQILHALDSVAAR